MAMRKILKGLMVRLLALTLAACALLSGCKASRDVSVRVKPVVPPGGVLLRGAGATFPSVLYLRWFDAYQKQHPDTVISYEAVGSGEGVRRFVGAGVEDDDQIEFGASDAAMRDEEMAHTASGALLIPMTAGGVALAYNLPGFDGDLKLSRKAYTGIFLGQIRNWNDPVIQRSNPGKKLPNLTITTVVRADSSGTTFAFTKHLDAISEQWRDQFGPATNVNWPGNAMRAKGNERVAAQIRESYGSIGYVGYEFARKIGLNVALLENKEGRFVPPMAANCEAALSSAELPENLRAYVPDPAGADSYPIVTLTWILVHRNYADAAKAKALQDLLAWSLGTDSQRIALDLGYVPLPDGVVQKSRAALGGIQGGSR
jgi:phosphate transport system substrate-binding protein